MASASLQAEFQQRYQRDLCRSLRQEDWGLWSLGIPSCMSISYDYTVINLLSR